MRRRGAYDRTLTLVAPLDELVEPRDDAVCASRSPGCGEGGHQPMSGAERGDAFGHVEDGGRCRVSDISVLVRGAVAGEGQRRAQGSSGLREAQPPEVRGERGNTRKRNS